VSLDLARLLSESGVTDLDKFSTATTTAEALRKYVASLNGAGKLDSEAARVAAVREMKAHKVRDAHRLASAAFAERAVVKGAASKPNLQGQAVTLADPEPWREPVDGAVLLAELMRTFTRFAVLPTGGVTALALWTLHAHAQDAAFVSPLLALTSPEKRCGKSTVLAVLGAVVPRALPTANITAAGVFRTVEKFRPSLMVDEADTFARTSEELRGILNSGHTRTSAFVVRTAGDDFEPRTFSTWCPKAIACIGELPATLTDRAIVVAMRRRKPDERVERLRLDRMGALEPLRRQAWRWSRDHATALQKSDPEMSPELDDRAADNWRPLVAIADLAGGAWPERARRAAVLLSGGRADALGARVQLVADLRALFAERGDRLASEEIVTALVAMEDRPWPEWAHGRPLTKRSLARLLEPFGIRPTQLRIDGDKTRGYARAAFIDAIARYLPSDPVQAVQPSVGEKKAGSEDPVLEELVPDAESTSNPCRGSLVPGVPDEAGAVGPGLEVDVSPPAPGSGDEETPFDEHADQDRGDAWEPEP